ncbi:AI-2E family transporter [Clostridiaceae bacterium DONG20-135]|uniref:AI-2E family transporter n=1 Tax=Copranaerobaculum intestinale TaxID=2692629 RepID=A0A6N8U647_9FIRM|nr:AI-2E family transporter [Copranaerobaculum intestinale]MXQ72794.1 AI-2E family transporter [Copranaerobaculum intestinale]
MVFDKKFNFTLKHILLIITYAACMVLVILNFQDLKRWFFDVLGLLRPFVYAFGLAYVFQLPMKFFDRKLPESINRFRKGLCVILSLLVILIVAAFIFQIVVPQLLDSLLAFIDKFPAYVESLQKEIVNLIDKFEINGAVEQQLNNYSDQIQEGIMSVLTNLVPALVDVTKGITSGVTNLFLTLVITVYFIISKDKLIKQTKRMMYAFTPDKANDYLTHVAAIANRTFASFISGQLIEAVIIGVLCYIGCLILRFPYAPILSVIIGCTNVIPIFGAIMGVGISALLVAFVNPIQGLFFIVFGICLQQFESNLIYPRVVGNSVGLSGLWVLFAITIGGGLFGFMGMLLGLPAFAVCYTLLREEMNRRIEKKTQKKASTTA